MFAINNFRKNALTDIVEVNGNHYCVDSVYTIDHGYETMVFACDANGNVTNWCDLYCDIYDTESEMREGHYHVVNNLAELI